MKPKLQSGEVYNNLTAIRKSDRMHQTSYLWECKCVCGKLTYQRQSDVYKGIVKSCGCKQTKHGYATKGAPKRIYKTWISMNQRCYNTKDSGYEYYGGRGIKVYKKWRTDFISYLEYIKSLPNCPDDLATVGRSSNTITIDRKDNDGNYEPGNLRWATRLEQANNRRIRSR